jgi:hypothetical protein
MTDPDAPSVKAILAGFALVLVLAGQAGAEPKVDPAASHSLDQETRATIVEKTAQLVEDHYVFPDLAARIAAELRSALRDGAYDEWSAPADLASALTRQLEVHDPHFWVGWSPPGRVEPVNADPHSDESGDSWREWARLQNYGFRRVDVLPGNVGYLDLRFFEDASVAGETAAAAMGFLANTDAVIVDVRHNGGGEPSMVQLLISYFMEPEPVQYNSFLWRGGTKTRQLWTLAYLPGKRMPSIPLYVVTSPRTGSAAEAFAYSLQALGRATVVGETTGGAAHPGESFDIGDGFGVFISTGAPVNPITGKNWEGVGVKPDVEVDSLKAVDHAHHDALTVLLPDAQSVVEKREVSWALAALEARRHPISLSESELEGFVGAYGTRKIRLLDGRLTYQRGRRAIRTMVRLEEQDVFVLEGVDGFRIRFERDDSGTIVRMVDIWSDGHTEASPKA